MVIRPANGLIGWTLRRTGFAGVTLPWGIYILPERLQDERLVRHEREHARQIEEHGVIGFYARYLWFTLRHGYRNNPLEVSARRAEELA
jgi:hypothetical protein